MRSRLIALALAAITVLVVVVPAEARAPGTTKVTIRYNGVGFDGQVKSNKEDKCANGRKVTVFKVKPGKDKKVGSDVAQADGDGYMWFVVDETASGKHYAKAGRVDGCESDKSKVVNASDG